MASPEPRAGWMQGGRLVGVRPTLPGTDHGNQREDLGPDGESNARCVWPSSCQQMSPEPWSVGWWASISPHGAGATLARPFPAAIPKAPESAGFLSAPFVCVQGEAKSGGGCCFAHRTSWSHRSQATVEGRSPRQCQWETVVSLTWGTGLQEKGGVSQDQAFSHRAPGSASVRIWGRGSGRLEQAPKQHPVGSVMGSWGSPADPVGTTFRRRTVTHVHLGSWSQETR